MRKDFSNPKKSKMHQPGDVFGTYTIIRLYPEKRPNNPQYFWKCKCRCGAVSVIPGQSVRKKPESCKKCVSGKRCISDKDRILHYNWAQYRSGAKKRKLSFELSYIEFVDLLEKPCCYCGIIPKPCNGIDRVNNKIGYTKENSAPCCFLCNRAKRELSPEYFQKWVNEIQKPLVLKPITIARVRSWTA